MKTRGLTLLMLIMTSLLFLLGADTPAPSSGSGGIDWFEVILITGYLLGVFVLLPLVIYTNMKEMLSSTEGASPLPGLSEDDRNERTSHILDSISEKLTPFQDNEGNELITITKGSQAKFMKFGLDYINLHLQPTDPLLKARIEDLTDVYNNRAQRAFTGSWWIIGASAGLGIFMFFMVGFQSFLVIHFLGLAFYVLSSRTSFYTIENRLEKFGNTPGFVNAIMTSLFIAEGAKEYVKVGDGPWQRDYNAEFSNSMATLGFLFVIAMVLGFMAAFMGVINFLFNYTTSFHHPFENELKWYDKHFAGFTPSATLEPA